MRLAQCGSMEAKALSFVLRAAGSEHHMSSTRRMFTYVVGGRVGMNDTCYFTLDMKKLDPTFTLYSTLLYSTLLYSTLLYSTLLYSTLLYSTLLYSTLLYSTLLYLCSLLIYTPSSVRHRPRRNRCVYRINCVWASF